MLVYTWLSWFAIALVVGCFAFVVGRALHLRLIAALLLAVLAVSASIGGLARLPAFLPMTSAIVVITAPLNNSQIHEYHLRVMGTVYPPNAQVTLVIRSEKDVQWWVQEIVRPQQIQGQIGLWSIDAFVGTPKEGQNQNFHIVALASADSVWRNLLTGRYLTLGNKLEVVPLWNQSAPVVVRRIE